MNDLVLNFLMSVAFILFNAVGAIVLCTVCAIKKRERCYYGLMCGFLSFCFGNFLAFFFKDFLACFKVSTPPLALAAGFGILFMAVGIFASIYYCNQIQINREIPIEK